MTYRTIQDMQAEEERLRQALAEKEAEVAKLWNATFHAVEESEFKTPTQRLLQYANTGAGLFDGALLGWKLYRRLGGTFSLFRRKKRR